MKTLNEILEGTGFTEKTKALRKFYKKGEAAFVYYKEFNLLKLVGALTKEREEAEAVALIILNGLENGHYAIRPGITGKGFQEGVSWLSVIKNKKLLKEAVGKIKESTIQKWVVVIRKIKEIKECQY